MTINIANCTWNMKMRVYFKLWKIEVIRIGKKDMIMKHNSHFSRRFSSTSFWRQMKLWWETHEESGVHEWTHSWLCILSVPVLLNVSYLDLASQCFVFHDKKVDFVNLIDDVIFFHIFYFGGLCLLGPCPLGFLFDIFVLFFCFFVLFCFVFLFVCSFVFFTVSLGLLFFLLVIDFNDLEVPCIYFYD